MTNITLGQAIDGSLSSTDLENPKRSGSLFDDYTLSGLSNWQQVKVNMESTAIDSYLQLVNASTGEVIDFNDDLPDDNLNSRLSFTKVPGVDYIIRATSGVLRPGKGDYTLNTTSLGIASSLVVTLNGQEAGTVDPLGRFVKIGNFVNPGSSSTFFDIAFSNDNKLLGIKKDPLPSQLYTINPQTGSSSVIGNFPSGVEMIALESSPNNILYGASRSKETSNSFTSSQLYAINPQTGDASSIADFPWDEGSGGDIAFDPVNNRFLFAKYSSDSSSTLFSVSLTGQSTKIGDIGFDGVVGLSFEGSTLIGFTGDNKRIIIDPETGEGTFDRDITGLSDGYTIIGAGSIPSATRTQAPTPPTSTSPLTTLPTTNNPGGASKSKYTASEINKDYLNPVDKATIRIWEDKDNDGKPDQNPTTPVKNVETYVISHGFKNDSGQDTATIAALAKQIGSPKEQGGEGKQVILIDWKDAAEAFQPGDAAQRISDVAAFSSDVLKRIWKIDNTNINLIGHSLGSLVASEIGLDLGTEDKDVLNSEYRKNPNIDQDKRVNTLIALDPPGDATTFLTSTSERGVIAFFEGYDLDKNRDGTQSPVDFNKVSKFSRAFWGNLLAGDGLGKPEFAATADESIYVDIKKPDSRASLREDDTNPVTSHGDIVYLFINLLQNSGTINNFFKLGVGKHSEWREDSFVSDEAILVANRSNNSEDNDPNISPSLLSIKNKNTQNNFIVYGSNGDDLLQGSNEFFTNKGDNLVYGYKGNDFIKLFVGGNDTIFGGKGDDFISGNSGNDTLIGDLNADNLDGGDNDDVLIGGKGKDTLTGGSGSDTFVFSRGDGASSRDDADIITDFGTGGLFGFFGGVDRIALADGLKADMIDLEPFGGQGGTGPIALKVKGTNEYLAVLNGNFKRDDLKFQENFVIPTVL